MTRGLELRREVADAVTEPAPNAALESASFGVYAFGTDQVASKTARFDYFKLVRDTVAPSVNLSLDPSTPSGLAGWWTDPVVATAMATDDQAGQVYVEQKVGTGDWSKYTATVPFTVVASYPETVKLVERYRIAGTVPLATAKVMKIQLGLAERAARRNQQVVATVALDLFLAKARTVRDVPARTLLTAVGQDLKSRLD
ncbi:hypothetical protein [Kribbella turkmenica]|uniref:hypothetical protein n=1 Tax=Kribbella turkmenica TaxID=2530375 RepID=UPI00192D7051|nr:hypothetical protein [Kribbella turkmenica]